MSDDILNGPGGYPSPSGRCSRFGVDVAKLPESELLLLAEEVRNYLPADPRDATIATLKTEVERLARDLFGAAGFLGDCWREEYRSSAARARALLARLEGKP